MSTSWSHLSEAQQHLSDVLNKVRTADADRARLEFISKEIASVDPELGEEVQIASDLLRAESSEQVIVLASTVRDALYAGENSAYDQLQHAREDSQTVRSADECNPRTT